MPVKYIGVGETIDDLQKFDSDEFPSRLFDTAFRVIISSKFTVYDGCSNSSVAVVLLDRKSTRLNSSHLKLSRMPSSA